MFLLWEMFRNDFEILEISIFFFFSFSAFRFVLQKLVKMEDGSGDDGAPATKRPRLDAGDLDWVSSSFGRKKAEGESMAINDRSPSAGGDVAGGWTLRNWSKEKEEEEAATRPAPPAEDWSFFYDQGASSSSSAASVADTTADASTTSSAASSSSSPFKVPKGRAITKRVSFSDEVKVVTIPNMKGKMDRDVVGEEFDAEGNPVNMGAGIEDLEGGDLVTLSEEEMEKGTEDENGAGAAAQTEEAKRSIKETGAEDLIQLLMSSVPTPDTQERLLGNKKYFGGSRPAKEGQEEGQQPPDQGKKAPKKHFNKEASEGLDEDSFLDAFIDGDDVVPTPALGDTAAAGGETEQQKQAGNEKKKASKPSFKF